MICSRDNYSEMEPVVLDGHNLRIEDVAEIAAGRHAVLGAEVEKACSASRQVVESVLEYGEVAYGINTGFGRLANKRIGSSQLRELQRNLILSHSSGLGEWMPDKVVRAMIALRVNALSRGFSGARFELLNALLALLNNNILPRVPSHGSVGASGDLAPLSHVALGLLGEGDVSWNGTICPAREALEACGLKPFELEAKEGLALINGTQFMTSLGCLALSRAGRLLKTADIVGAMSVEGFKGTTANLHRLVHEVRGHAGQAASASNLRRIMQDSALMESHKGCDRVQDPYSFRCMPQIHGAAREGWKFSSDIIGREINAVTDNPLVFPLDILGDEAEGLKHGLIISGGNFHGAPVALALDTAAIAMSYIGTVSERRCDKMLAGAFGLNSFLAKDPGVNSGYMIVQYAAAALVNENKVYCHPASVDTVPTSAGQEDHNSHGPTAAHKLNHILDNIERILACELICAGQALDERRPLTFGKGTEVAFQALRACVEPLDEDRPPYKDIEAARELIASGNLLEATEKVTGILD